jgi:hypothetical protein
MSLVDFMGHSSKGGKNNYFKAWKEKNPPAATVWLHPKASILALWRHSFFKLNPVEKDGVKSIDVWGDRLVCFEDESVLQDMHFRDRETGRRRNPPVLCPICLMLEHIHQLVLDSQLDWRTPLFKFEGTDPRQTRILHAGGVTGLFNNRKLTDAQKAQMAGTDGDPKYTPPSLWHGPIYQSGDGPNVAFKQDCRPRLEYAFTIVDNDDVVQGVQIDIEPASLGDKVREVIRKEILNAKSDPRDQEGRRGNPALNPYALRFEYTPKVGNDFPKYDAMPMRLIARTPAIEKLLQGDPPDVEGLARRFEIRTLRARLERQQLVKLPLDTYFAPAFKAEAAEKANPQPAERTPEVQTGTRVPVSQTDVPISTTGYKYPPAPIQYANGNAPQVIPQAAAPEPDIFGCDQCGEAMRATDPVCLKCGMKYVVEQAPAPPKAVLPKRSQAGIAPSPAPVATSDPWGLTPAAPQAPMAEIPAPSDAAEPEGGGWPGDPSSDIPFAFDATSGGALEEWDYFR